MNGRTVHRSGTLLLSLLMAAIGLALIGQVIAGDGGVLSARLLLGVLFLAGGVARVWLEYKRGGGREGSRR